MAGKYEELPVYAHKIIFILHYSSSYRPFAAHHCSADTAIEDEGASPLGCPRARSLDGDGAGGRAADPWPPGSASRPGPEERSDGKKRPTWSPPAAWSPLLQLPLFPPPFLLLQL